VQYHGVAYAHATWVPESRLRAEPFARRHLEKFLHKFGSGAPDDEDVIQDLVEVRRRRRGACWL
jgi:hypothetical protein